MKRILLFIIVFNMLVFSSFAESESTSNQLTLTITGEMPAKTEFSFYTRSVTSRAVQDSLGPVSIFSFSYISNQETNARITIRPVGTDEFYLTKPNGEAVKKFYILVNNSSDADKVSSLIRRDKATSIILNSTNNSLNAQGIVSIDVPEFDEKSFSSENLTAMVQIEIIIL